MQAEKTPEPLPTLTWGRRYPCECGPGARDLPFVLWRGVRRGNFFNPTLKFAPTRSQTQVYFY